jgi:hypothetical protein
MIDIILISFIFYPMQFDNLLQTFSKAGEVIILEKGLNMPILILLQLLKNKILKK